MEKIYIKWNFINDRTEHNFNFYGQEVAFRINVFNSKNKMIFNNIECNTVLLGIDETMFDEEEINAKFVFNYLKEYYIESINEMLNDINKQGYVSLNQLTNDVNNKTTLNTVNTN